LHAVSASASRLYSLNRRLSGKKKVYANVNWFTFGNATRPQYERSTLQFSIWSLEELP
jgi:hypothetical protein